MDGKTRFADDATLDYIAQLLSEKERLTAALLAAKGTFEYIATQAKLQHIGFDKVAIMNCEAAIQKINEVSK